MKLPTLPKKLPSATAEFTNGNAPAHLLRDPGDGLGPLLIVPSYGMQALHIYAAQHGFTIETTGRGRTYAQQVTLFRARYTPTYDPTVNTLTDQRTWNGQVWYKRKNVAAAATPGTSNHGWWCADDLSEENDSDPQTDPVSPELIEFLIPIAHEFGWSWELQSEPWHVSWISGDVLPPRAVQVLLAAGVLDPEEDEMAKPLAMRPKGYQNVFLVQAANAIHASPEMMAAWDIDVADIVDFDHTLTLKGLLAKSMLSPADLVKG